MASYAVRKGNNGGGALFVYLFKNSLTNRIAQRDEDETRANIYAMELDGG